VGQGRLNVLDQFATCGSFYELAGTLYREAFWLVSDHLGTPRMIVNKSGTLAGVKRHDYLPFGEELYAGMGSRTTTQGYTGDSVRQHFTGYEADAETGLNFAQARYQSPTQGRFTSVDPLGRSASVLNPQSFNRYAYVLNNPTNLTDPSGMIPYNGPDQSWSDVANGFWGSSFNFNGSHFGGPAIIANGMNGFSDRRNEGAGSTAYAGDGTVDSGAGETPADEGKEPQDNRPLITDMVQPNEGVGTDDNGNYRFHANANGTSGHNGEHVLGAREGSTISAISGLTGRVLTWYTQDPGPNGTFGVFMLLSDQKTVMVLKDVENLSSKVRQAPYGPHGSDNQNS
jgi:RHS repeat-associated protein